MVRAWTVARLLIAALMLAAVLHDLSGAIDSGTFVIWNFFGFFTIQTNLIGIVTLIIAARFTGAPRPAWVEYLRACAATYLVIVVTVFWTLLAPTSDGLWTWTNLVLHGVSGVVLLADWLLEGPRTRASAATRVDSACLPRGVGDRGADPRRHGRLVPLPVP